MLMDFYRHSRGNPQLLKKHYALAHTRNSGIALSNFFRARFAQAGNLAQAFRIEFQNVQRSLPKNVHNSSGCAWAHAFNQPAGQIGLYILQRFGPLYAVGGGLKLHAVRAVLAPVPRHLYSLSNGSSKHRTYCRYLVALVVNQLQHGKARVVTSEYYVFDGTLYLHIAIIPSVDKDTQGFRSQTARHNCVVLI